MGEFLAASPILARAALVEGPTAGPRALQHCAQVRRALAEVLKTWHETTRQRFPDYPAAPDTAYTAVAGAMHELAFQQVIAGQAGELRQLEPAIMHACQALLNLPDSAEAKAIGNGQVTIVAGSYWRWSA